MAIENLKVDNLLRIKPIYSTQQCRPSKKQDQMSQKKKQENETSEIKEGKLTGKTNVKQSNSEVRM